MADVEAITSSVVREYLSRKGLNDTLAMLDTEMPRTDNCISNRAQLAKELHINSLMKKNKERQDSFRTMLEVIVQFMMAKTWQQKHSVQNITEHGKLTTKREDHVKQPESNSINSKNERTEIKQDLKLKGVTQDNQEPFKSFGRNQKRKSFEKNESRTSIDDKLKSSLTEESLLKLDNKINLSSDMDLNVQHGSSKISSRPSRVSGSRLSVSNNEMDVVTASEKQFYPEHFSTETRNTEGLTNKINYQDKNIFGTSPGVTKRTSLNDTPSISSSNVKKNSQRQMSGSITSTGLQSLRKNERTRYAKEGFRKMPKYLVEDVKEHNIDNQWRNSEILSTDEKMSMKQDMFSGKDETKKHVKESFREKPKYLVEDLQESEEFEGRRSPERIALHSDNNSKKPQKMLSVGKLKERQNKNPDWKKEIIQKKDARKSPPPSHFKTNKKEELMFEDIDDDLDGELDKFHFSAIPRKSTMFQCQPITLKQAKDLKTIVFGTPAGSFNLEWKNQGLSFCHLDHLKYGIVQRKGGPCGLLASVQAVVLKQLLFNDRLSASISKPCFSSQETNNALCSALVEILWRAGNCKKARVALRSEKDQFIPSGGYKADRFTEKLVIYEMNDFSELGIFIRENMKQLSSEDGGCILLLYSVILSRTIEKIKDDMDDDNGTLMGAHGYCTQDMVNLLLTGKAISNTFDDVIELDSGGDTKSILKGVEQQSDIGLLSLFEHYKSCLVGSNLKSPKYPIWVVCSESHFSVLFSMKRSLVNERKTQKIFDLYYYDGLAAQTEEIRLTVDHIFKKDNPRTFKSVCVKCHSTRFLANLSVRTYITGKDHTKDALDDLTPPLDHCIRTKWKDAVIDWNDTEPLL